MKFSVVTVCYNAMPFIKQCVASVAREKQRCNSPIEHIVVDGGSTDGTLEHLRLQPRIRMVSEPDEGISDAMNKGLEMAKGQFVLFLNADDELVPEALDSAHEFLEKHPHVRWLQGHVVYIDAQGSVVGRQIAHERLVSGLRRSTKFNQQAALMHREIFEQVGGFDTDFNYVMDYDFWLRIFQQYRPHCVDLEIARYRMHCDNRSRANVWQSEYEKHLVRMKNREALPGMTWLESIFYVAATYFRSPTVAHYLALGALDRGQWRQALGWMARNLCDKPLQSPEHLATELREILRHKRSS